MRGIDGKAICLANDGTCSREQEEICEENPDERCIEYEIIMDQMKSSTKSN